MANKPPFKPTHLITDHICCHCSGRLLESLDGFRCADCGEEHNFRCCWCTKGFHCVRLDTAETRPEFVAALAKCGFNAADKCRAEVGVVLEADYRLLMKEY